MFADSPLFWSYYPGMAYTGGGFSESMRGGFSSEPLEFALLRDAYPRIHDFRHSFAVHALLRWFTSGQDVQAKLPMLSVYMGHVSIFSTQYYHHFVQELAATASRRFAERYGTLVTSPLAGGGEA